MNFFHLDRTKSLKIDQTIDYFHIPENSNEEIIEYCESKFSNNLSHMGFIYANYATPSYRFYCRNNTGKIQTGALSGPTFKVSVSVLL